MRKIKYSAFQLRMGRKPLDCALSPRISETKSRQTGSCHLRKFYFTFSWPLQFVGNLRAHYSWNNCETAEFLLDLRKSFILRVKGLPYSSCRERLCSWVNSRHDWLHKIRQARLDVRGRNWWIFITVGLFFELCRTQVSQSTSCIMTSSLL